MLHLAKLFHGKFSETRAILAGLIAINDADARLYKHRVVPAAENGTETRKSVRKSLRVGPQDPTHWWLWVIVKTLISVKRFRSLKTFCVGP